METAKQKHILRGQVKAKAAALPPGYQERASAAICRRLGKTLDELFWEE